MSMTPGPWFASNEHEDEYGFAQVTIGPFEVEGDEDHVEETIAYVSGINHDANANASVICAAPDLLAALKALRIDANRLCDRNLGGSYEDDCRRAIAIADKAIAKVSV